MDLSALKGLYETAVELLNAGRLDEAEVHCRAMLDAVPEQLDALLCLTLIEDRRGRLYASRDLLERALRVAPRHQAAADSLRLVSQRLAQAALMPGAALGQAGRPLEAAAVFMHVLRLDPASAHGHNELGAILGRLGRHAEALAHFDQALAAAPDFASPHDNRGITLMKLGRYAEALEAHDRAIALAPGFAFAHDNRGLTLDKLGRFAEALASHERAIPLAPDTPNPHNNCGMALTRLGRYEEALQSYARAMALEPEHTSGHWNRANALLALGDYAAGWREYEWRWRGPGVHHLRHPAATLWLGEPDIRGRTLLCWAEQGFGDTLQFCRYLPLLAARGARVILQVEAPLVALCATLGADIAVLPLEQPAPPFDFHIPLLSLPHALGTTLETVPAAVPYLRADPAKAQHFAQLLGPRRHPRVGLVWSGELRQNDPELWPVNHRRNIPLELFAGLNLPGIEFVSLQKGPASEAELEREHARLWPEGNLAMPMHAVRDFADTAALITHLDLLIAVDTSTLHLAGALGKPVWLLNRFDTCWRWMAEREDSPWYPTLRIFRQQTPGDWAPVVARAREALQAWRAAQ